VITGFVILVLLLWAEKRRGKGGVSICTSAIIYWFTLMAFFWPAIIYDRCLIPGDILFQYYPWKAQFPNTIPHNRILSDCVVSIYPWMCSIKNAFFEGSLPLWNHYSYCGSPLAGNLASAAFHPFNLLLLVMPVEDVNTLLPFLRLFAAAMGVYILLRTWGIAQASSFLGGLLYAFCGVHIVWLSNYPNTNITVLMPWVFLCLDRISIGRHWSWVFIFSLLSCLQFLGGHPETSFHLYVVAVLFFLWRLHGEWRKGVGIMALTTRLCLVGVGGLLAISLCAFQLLPFLEYLPLTSRYQDIAVKGQNMFLYLDFAEVLKTASGTLISPDFFGNPVDQNYWGFANYNEQNAHITVTGLLFALLAFGCGGSHRGLKRFFAILGLLSFMIVVRTPGFFELVVSLPLFKLAGNHRLIFVFAFCASVLAALEASDRESGEKGRFWMPALAAAFLVVLAGGLHLSSSRDLNDAQSLYRVTHLSIYLIFLLMATAISMAARWWPKMARYLPHAAAILVIVEVFVWGCNYNTFLERSRIFPNSPILRFINSRPRPFRVVGLHSLLRGSEQVFRFDSIIGMDPMKLASYEKVMARINGAYHPVDTPNVSSIKSPWLNFLNVKYVVTSPRTPDTVFPYERFKLVYDEGDGKVYENLNCVPRAFWAEKIIVADSQQNALKMAVAHESDLNRVVILEDYEKIDLTSFETKMTQNPKPVVVRYDGGHIVLEVETPESACLVLSEAYYPRWHFRIDGKEFPVLRANSAFVAALLPAGTKRVEFFYDPGTFKIGVGISCFGFLVLLMIGLVFFQRRCKKDTIQA
jgi:hypothetical protein